VRISGRAPSRKRSEGARRYAGPVSGLDDLPEPWRRGFGWIERALGGRIVRAERQARWRPAWFLDLERDGESLPLYFRGARPEMGGAGERALERELRIFEVLEAHDIPVPHVYGLCPEPRGIVMQRCPGRANLATAESDAEREAVLDDYMAILARMHRIDIAAFDATGLARPETPEQAALLDFDEWERAYRMRTRRPEPALEFLIRWVRREVPRDRSRTAFVCADSGQFLFENGGVTAVLDLELACLGDPAADLGALPGRDVSEPLGDLSRAVRRYEELTESVERRIVDFHTVRFSLLTPLALAHLVVDPLPGVDFVQYLGWYLVWTRCPLEIIGAGLGVELDPPPGADARHPATAGARDFADYEADAAARLATYRERSERMTPALEAAYLDDLAPLLGGRPSSRQAADAALVALIREAPPERDGELVPLLHRQAVRDESILEPVMRELRGATMQRIREP
jgi:hypothetical protein